MTMVLLLAGALLPGCGLFAGPNHVRTRGNVPLDIGAIESALWVGDVESWGDAQAREMWGSGTLLLVDASVSCDDLREGRDDYLWDHGGLVADFRWWEEQLSPEGEVEEAWVGPYYGGVDYASFHDDVRGSRSFAAGVFADGTFLVYDYARGVAEITGHDDDTVSGRLETSVAVARFQAENCGEERRTGGGDSGGWGGWDTAWDGEAP